MSKQHYGPTCHDKSWKPPYPFLPSPSLPVIMMCDIMKNENPLGIFRVFTFHDKYSGGKARHSFTYWDSISAVINTKREVSTTYNTQNLGLNNVFDLKFRF